MKAAPYSVVMRLDMAVQSWGSGQSINSRQTDSFPTLSGIVGMTAAALGIRREQSEEIAELASYDMAVRRESIGVTVTDYQTKSHIFSWKHRPALAQQGQWSIFDAFVDEIAAGAAKPGGNIKKAAERHYGADNDASRSSALVHNQYLNDSEFVVALGMPSEDRAREVAKALRSPVFPLYAGRKSATFGSLAASVVEDDPCAAVTAGFEKVDSHIAGVEGDVFAVERTAKTGEVADSFRIDLPVSFEPTKRVYVRRPVVVSYYRKVNETAD